VRASPIHARVSFELAFENWVISCFKPFSKVFDRLKPRLGFFRQILVQTENDFSLVAHSGFAVPCKRRGRKVLCHKFGVEMKARAGDMPIYSPGADVFLRNEIHDPACNVVLEALNDNFRFLI